MKSFTTKIYKIGINPYVLLPERVLNDLFKQAEKGKGPIPVRGKLNGHKFIQTLVKYSGRWRLYLNTPMRWAAGIDVGDKANVEIEYDDKNRTRPIHPRLSAAFKKNKTAEKSFSKLTPSRQKEILRYLIFLKTEESIRKNIDGVIKHLSGKERFAGRN